EEIAEFRARVAEAGLVAVISHASYLINLAAVDGPLRQRSMAAMADEIDRANALGLLGVVLHPGSCTSGTEADGLRRIADALVELLASRQERTAGHTTLVLLEHTAGQGSALGKSFEEIATILEHTDHHPRLGVCLDTCHLLASGYDIASAAGYADVFARFEQTIGLPRLRAFHLNDSKKPLGSRVDRHEHIGKGFVGLDAFRRLVNDPRFASVPMMLETPKAAGKSSAPIAVDAFDEENLRTLRDLYGK
ncbi:MAG: deoxyribonuclease IV, partial [Acidobacteriaceae bacterium]|nr:deoxyribonuclease IV [Acidobacteriaceae bacterium]